MPSRSQQKILRSLGTRKGREEKELFLVEGPTLLPELLVSGLGLAFLLYTREGLDEAGGDELLERVRGAGVPAEEVDAATIREFSDTVTPRGVLAVARIPRRGWSDLPDSGLLVFDGVQDPGNLGTLIRTAEAMGMRGLVSLPGTVDAWNPKAVRASAGSIFRLPLVSAPREEAEAELRARGIRIWAADVEGEPVDRWETPPPRLALVLGNEGRGVSDPVLAGCDRRVRIPLSEGVESLNVAVAGALLIDRIFGAHGAGRDDVPARKG